MIKVKNKKSGCFRNSQSGNFFCRLRSLIDTCKKQKLPILNSILNVFNFSSFQFARQGSYTTLKYYNTLENSPRYGTNRSPYSGTVLRLQLRNQLHERSGISSFLEPFFFSFHKEKKKVTERFEIKEEFKLKKLVF